MKTKKRLTILAILVCLTLTVGVATAKSYSSQVTLLEFYIDGCKGDTITNPLQTVDFNLPRKGYVEVRIYVILENKETTKTQLEAWTSIENPIYSGFSESGSVGTQYGPEWTAPTQQRLILDLTGKIDCSAVEEKDILYRLSNGPYTICIVNVVHNQDTTVNSIQKTVESLFAGQNSLIFYPLVIAIAATVLFVRSRLKPEKVRDK